ncbi:ATP-binding protein [Rhodoferax koreense]|nr:ATP-binding protein [Rhodoferax koreense]
MARHQSHPWVAGTGGDMQADSAMLAAIFLANPDALLAVDGDGAIVLANHAATNLLGYSEQELRQMNVDMLVPANARAAHATHRQDYARAPQARPMGERSELCVRCKDGQEVMVEIALSPMARSGRPMVLASIRSIGAYPRVRQALRRARYSESLARLGHVVVNARDPQTVLDLLPGVAAEALEVENVAVFLLEDDHQHLRVASSVGDIQGQQTGMRIPYEKKSSLGLVLAGGHNLIVEDYCRETRFDVPEAYLRAGLASAGVTPVHDHGRMIGALAARSRTPSRFGSEEMHYLESLASLLGTYLQRVRADAALRHAQTLESVGQLSGGIAHDFNNLLTVIQGNLEVLGERPPSSIDDEARELVGTAARAARRAAELTAKLLAFSRRQVLQPTAVNVAALISSLADMLRRTLDRRIEISVRVDPQCPAIQVDEVELEAALLNIAVNARDAMPEGGRLRFEATRSQALPDDVRTELTEDAARGTEGFVTIAVTDDGCGMPPQVKERAFEPFFTTKPQGRGTGLGLSTVFGFVKQSHGTVRIDSESGRGTTVRLYMPCAAARQACAEPAPPSEALPVGLHVLLVEDDHDVQATTVRLLHDIGCKVHAFNSGEAALDALPRLGTVDLLLTDVALGRGMRGTALAAKAQGLRPSMAVVLMSAFSTDLLQVNQEAPPDWELLAKPFSREELSGALALALHQR